MPRLGITAYAAINGLGRDTASVLEGLYAGNRGLSPAPSWLGIDTFVGRVEGDLDPLPEHLAAYDTRQARLTAATLDGVAGPVAETVARFGSDRVAILLGTSTAGVADTEHAYATYLKTGALPERFDFRRQHAFEAIVDVVRAMTGIEGPGYVVSTACSSSGRVFASARRLIRAGVVDAALVGGIDTLCALTVRGFASLSVISDQPSRPFCEDRTGINIGEGGAMLLVERIDDDPARARVELLGVGESSDAHHMTAPHPEGRGALAAMRGALVQAGFDPDDPSVRAALHVNAHGTGTRQNDAVEGRAIATGFGAVPIVATKGATGHLLGAAGATEALFCVAALERGKLPPSVGATPVEGDLDVVLEARSFGGRLALSNSFAFGGANVTTLLGRTEDTP